MLCYVMYEQALSTYQMALQTAQERLRGDAAQERVCRVGIAKMTLRLGDVNHGIQLALDSGDQQCCRDCADILEALKQYQDAARLCGTPP